MQWNFGKAPKRSHSVVEHCNVLLCIAPVSLEKWMLAHPTRSLSRWKLLDEAVMAAPAVNHAS
jgi:hypothetical protein